MNIKVNQVNQRIVKLKEPNYKPLPVDISCLSSNGELIASGDNYCPWGHYASGLSLDTFIELPSGEYYLKVKL